MHKSPAGRAVAGCYPARIFATTEFSVYHYIDSYLTYRAKQGELEELKGDDETESGRFKVFAMSA